ncbi:MAG: 50S ribosomal protein L2 [Candidatus Kappaea frigidicola]|nr:50S ribosomal protein L2 [Candidatus Kappaea frigidicola]
MGIKLRKPTTSSQRWTKLTDFKELDPISKKPHKALTQPLKKSGGRNVHGRITSRHRGGGHKRKYRIIDFKRNKDVLKATVISIEYDPNRTANIALLDYEDGEKRYIVSPVGLKVNDVIVSGEKVEIKIGNCMALKNIPAGIQVHNIGLNPNEGAKIARGAGTAATVMAVDGKVAHIKMPSGEIRLINKECRATIGQVGNIEHERETLGKAGRRRWMGKRSKVRGVAMNPVDHPMGGGEGKSSGGRHPTTPWGKATKGLKTRKKKKFSNKSIVRRRPSKNKRRK